LISSSRKNPHRLPPSLLVAAGGALGTLARQAIDTAFPTAPGAFPWTTLAINTAGSLLLGLVALAGVVLVATTGDVRTFLLVGLCGAFTTFSGFGWEATRLWSSARSAFWAAVIVMPVACVVAFLVAWSMTTAITGG